jgi:hypothetical protein
MTFVHIDDLPAADKAAPELEMVRSLIVSLQVTQAQIASLQARETTLYTSLVELVELQTARLPEGARRDREMPLRTATAEIATALRITERTVQRRMSDASTLMLRFGRTHAALSEGRISHAHASVIMDAGVAIADDEARAAFELAALDRAEIETAGRLRSIVQSIAERLHPVSIADRHRAARERRSVFVRDIEDGMAELSAVLPAVLAHGIHDRLTQMAHHVRTAARAEAAVAADEADAEESATPTDERTMDQLRADILTDLALAASPVASGDGLDAITAHVQVTIPVLTLAGVHDDGADLAGAGPIDPDTARRLAANAPGWDRVMTHPITGAILAIDRYRVTADLERALRVRDEHCRFPGCRQPPWRCDRDHTHDAARGGRTCLQNLECLCRRHHILKHATEWGVRQLGGGTLEWTSPTGLTYIDIPPTTLRFVPDGDPPPF